MSTKKRNKSRDQPEDDWAIHKKKFREMQMQGGQRQRSVGTAKMERQIQYGVGVALAVVSLYFILGSSNDIEELKATNINTKFAGGDPWLVLCDKHPVKEAIKRTQVHEHFLKAADVLSDEGVMAGVLDCDSKFFKKGKSAGVKLMDKFKLSADVGNPVIFTVWKDKKRKSRNKQLPAKALKSVEDIVAFVKDYVPSYEELLERKEVRSGKRKPKTGAGAPPEPEEIHDYDLSPPTKDARRKDRARRKEAAKKARLIKEQENLEKSGGPKLTLEEIERKDREKRARQKMEEAEREQIPQAVNPEDVQEVEEEEEENDEGEIIDLDMDDEQE